MPPHRQRQYPIFHNQYQRTKGCEEAIETAYVYTHRK